MKKLLAAILSISILVSSVTPSLAQLVPASGRQLVKGLAGKGVEGLSAVAGKQAMKEVIPAAAERGALSSGIYSLSSSVLPKSFSDKDSKASLEGTKSLQISLDRSIRQQLLRSGRDIRESVKAGQVEGMAALILNHPNAAFRQWLLRNEFVTVALQGGATRAQIAEAIKCYRENLSQAQEIFKKLPENDLNSLLQIAKNPKHPGYQNVSDVHGLLSSAAALGLLGARADAAVLKGFYQAAKGSAFEDTAMVIAARGMLRAGAYSELEELAALSKAEGPFWQELGAFVQSKGLPVHIEAAASSDVQAELPLLPLFLRAGCEPNFLNADISQQATEKWLALGTKQPKEAVAALEQAKAVTPLRLEVPSFALKEIPLQVSAVSMVEQESVAGATEGAVLAEPSLRMPPNKTQKAVQFFTKNEGTETSEGILYSGLPVWGIGNVFKKAGNWLRSKFGNSTERSVAGVKEEVPGLHDASEISEVVSVLPSSEAPASADDLMSLNETELVSVAEKGLKLTIVDEQGIEQILPVRLEVSNRFRLKGYNRIAFASNPNFTNRYIAELRNQKQAPLRMAHFYIRLQSNQVGALADLIQPAGIKELHLKLENIANVEYKTIQVPVYDYLTGSKLPLKVDLPLKNYPDNAKMVIMESGELGLLKEGETTPASLEGFYVRLPKNQIANFVEVLRFSPTVFNISVHPTQNRASLIIRDASLTNVSLGKTMGPVVNKSLDMQVSAANSMMFTINYILPGLASLLTPILKKYGEKKLMALSLAMSTAAGALASAGGFYGFVENLSLGPVSKGLFITALFLMSGSSILKQVVSNMLIRANRGEVILDAAKAAVKKSETEFTAQEKQGFAQMGVRLKEFFTKESDVSLKDVVLYNLSFVYKNIGTLAFLASPYLINSAVLLSTGIDLGIDYSISFPIYALYSGAVAWKVWRAKLRDAYSAKNLEQSQRNLEKTLSSGAKALAGIEGKISDVQIDDAARAFKDALDSVAFANVKLTPGKKKSQFYAEAKKSFLQNLKQEMLNTHQMDPVRAEVILSKIKSSMSMQENTVGNMLKMLRVPGVTSLATAMTLATVHEFVVSSSFATTMKQLVAQGEFANFLIASSLYVPLIVGRLGGNLISRRISADSMYIFSSALSALGTGVMIAAGDSVTQMVAGAAIASFGIGNFFTQMYDYIMNRYPKYNRELSSILSFTMALAGLGAIPAGYLAAMTGIDASALLYAGAALGASLVLTPGMMLNSTLVKGAKYEAKRLWKGVKNLFKRGGNHPGTPGNLDDAAPIL